MAKKKLHAWRITELRKKGHYIGSVEATTADEAIKVAIKEFMIDSPERQKRLVAQRER
jgi:hypothetical protein